MLATLLDFDFKDPRSRAAWELNHAADHVEIRQAIEAQKTNNLSDWVLYPVPWEDLHGFAIRHQMAHNDFNSIFGLSGNDLTGVDFNDPKAAADWNFVHFAEHQAVRSALKI
jgi:hypothetical protein